MTSRLGSDSVGESYPESYSESSERVEQEPVREPSDMMDRSETALVRGEDGGVGRDDGEEKLVQLLIRCLSSPMVILFSGFRSKIRQRILFKSSDKGKMVFKNSESLVNALYVESSTEACFHGLRPQVRLTRITPRDQMSLGAHRYDGLLELWSKHSRKGEMG